MQEAELVGLLEKGVPRGPARWADLGSGDGAFTTALAKLLGPGAGITAVDRDRGALDALRHEMGRYPETGLAVVVADFTRPLELHDLDGVVMANSLHFVRHKKPVLEAVRSMLRPGGRLIVVEYSTDRANPWVPHPFLVSDLGEDVGRGPVPGDGADRLRPQPLLRVDVLGSD